MGENNRFSIYPGFAHPSRNTIDRITVILSGSLLTTIFFLLTAAEHSLPHRRHRVGGSQQRSRQEVGLGGLVPGLWRLPRARVLLKLPRLPGSKAPGQIRTDQEDESGGERQVLNLWFFSGWGGSSGGNALDNDREVPSSNLRWTFFSFSTSSFFHFYTWL